MKCVFRKCIMLRDTTWLTQYTGNDLFNTEPIFSLCIEYIIVAQQSLTQYLGANWQMADVEWETSSKVRNACSKLP